MLTQEKLKTLLDIRQAELAGEPSIAIPQGWTMDLLAMLENMALRNEILRAENRDLRLILDLSKGSDK